MDPDGALHLDFWGHGSTAVPHPFPVGEEWNAQPCTFIFVSTLQRSRMGDDYVVICDPYCNVHSLNFALVFDRILYS